MEIFVAVGKNYEIGKNNQLPWKMIREDMIRFKNETSLCKENNINAVIMGRKTWESIPKKHQPLKDRINIILSRNSNFKLKFENPEVNNLHKVCQNMNEGIKYLMTIPNLEKIFIIGGSNLYNEALDSNLVSYIHMTKIDKEYDADTFFPKNFEKINKSLFTNTKYMISDKKIITNENEHDLLFLKYHKINHEENKYLDVLKELIETGEERNDRTGTGTLAKFGETLEFDLRNGTLPMLTTKKVFLRGVLEELLWFIKGDTNSKRLEEKNVNIWKGNTSREYLDSNGFEDYPEGQLGPLYGFNWRSWGAEYKGMEHDHRGEGFDQLLNAINLIKNDPTSRRILVSAWNVSVLKEGVLPPCHIMFQFYVNKKENTLSCQTYQRSVDWMLGCPFNITSYALLTHMMAHITGLMPGKLKMCFGDTHLYKDHIDGAKLQISREPKPFPRLNITRKVDNIDDFKFEDFKVMNYLSEPAIKLQMSA